MDITHVLLWFLQTVSELELLAFGCTFSENCKDVHGEAILRAEKVLRRCWGHSSRGAGASAVLGSSWSRPSAGTMRGEQGLLVNIGFETWEIRNS